MKLKLKEEPNEWLKFTVVVAVAVSSVAFLLNRRKIIDLEGIAILGITLVAAVIACAIRPRWFRGFYRAGMTASFHVGQMMGRVLLTFFFLLALTPLGLFLRLLGKDLLAMKYRKADTYWHSAKTSNQFDRQF